MIQYTNTHAHAHRHTTFERGREKGQKNAEKEFASLNGWSHKRRKTGTKEDTRNQSRQGPNLFLQTIAAFSRSCWRRACFCWAFLEYAHCYFQLWKGNHVSGAPCLPAVEYSKHCKEKKTCNNQKQNLLVSKFSAHDTLRNKDGYRQNKQKKERKKKGVNRASQRHQRQQLASTSTYHQEFRHQNNENLRAKLGGRKADKDRKLGKGA